jgi:two-component system LytT family sensor kinase
MILKTQMLLLFVISTLLYIGFPGAREWRRLAEGTKVQTIILGWDGLAWYAWLAAAPLMLVMIRRYPLVHGRIGRNLGKIFLGSVALYLLVAHLRYFLRILPNLWLPAASDLPTDWRNYLYNTFRIWPIDFLTYCGFFAVSFSIDYYFQNRQRTQEAVQFQLRTVQLESDLARAELAALRGQLHPHFLFNSFNALATLVRQQKNEAAVEIIAQLSALLRLALERTGLQEIPLEEEIDFISRYLEIEHVRFGDKLRIAIAVEPAALGVLLPNLVLQPLVENAIKHGISRRTTPGLVRIQVGRTADRLRIEIADDGPDNQPQDATVTDMKKPGGIGMTNTRARLDRLYGTDYQLRMSPRPEGGTVVALNLPWRPAPATLSSP